MKCKYKFFNSNKKIYFCQNLIIMPKKETRGRKKIDPKEKKIALVVTVKKRHYNDLLPIIKKTVTDYERGISTSQHHP